jgi:hypothetical protein
LALLEELFVRSLGLRVDRVADVIEHGEDAGRGLSFDEVAHDLVVKVLDGLPLDSLLCVLFLLSLECELDEELLQLLVDIVDAELLESVVLLLLLLLLFFFFDHPFHQLGCRRKKKKKKKKKRMMNLKDLKAKDIEHGNDALEGHVVTGKSAVDLGDEVVKDTTVDGLGDGVTGVRGLLDILRHIVGRHTTTSLTSVDETLQDDLLQVEGLDAQH